MRKAFKIFSNALFVAGMGIAGLFLVAHFTGQQPFKVYVVTSGSMEPAIKTGSIVVVVPKPIYQIGDVVSFQSSPGSKSTTTHRIVASGFDFFKVAGDANDDPDPNSVLVSDVVGSVRLTVPYVGYLSGFAKTPRGFILLIIVPATIIIYEELKSLFSGLKKFWDKPALIILPVIFAILISISISISYFIDRETSAGNTFVHSVPTPAPTP